MSVITSGCVVKDTTCFCKDQALLDSLLLAVEEACSQSEVEGMITAIFSTSNLTIITETIEWAQSMCKSVGVTVTPPAPSPTPSRRRRHLATI